MLIRNQDRICLVNMDVIDAVTISCEKNYYIESWRGEIHTFLGEYETEEKAIKVLDMIQKSYLQAKICGTIYADGGYPHIFTMPKDEEIE